MIRVATISDGEMIRALMQSVPGFWDGGWRTDVLERVLHSADTIAIVHLAGGRIEGFACAHDVGFRGYLSELIVSPSLRGSGIGTSLLAEIERRLAERGCSLVIADVWPDAEAFYRAQGWSPPPVVLLRKKLGPSMAELPPKDGPPSQATPSHGFEND
jgi:ribosomal protein S18 acetylase RimI-like enzyme